MIPDRTCAICGKTFTPKSSRRSYCYEDHYHPCPVCGVPVLTKDTYHLNECCCLEHSRQLAVRSNHERHEIWPSNSDEAKEKRKQTCLDRYGVENVSYDPEMKKLISKRLREENAKHPEYRQKAIQTYFEKTGYYAPACNPEVQKKIKERNMREYGTDNPFAITKDKADATNLEKYGTTIPMQNPDIQSKQRKSRSSYVGCDGTPLDSQYEVDVYDYCMRNNIPIIRTVPISFEYLGEQHKTFIDFDIDGILVEVKGAHIMNGYFDSQPNAVPMWRKLEVYRENHVIVITSREAIHHFTDHVGLKYLDKCPNPLIGVDIQLFQKPQFPFAPNKPECFYKVSVNGQRSALEGFFDEKLRWNMIRNRIDYVGGFISNKEVLTAMNVTRTCKQPSWFALSYAQKLLKKYSVSDVIVDPFAGWGTRHDAAVGLYKKYIGCDLNPELVEWHQSKGRSIILQDAKEFRYEGECDIFICPPYKDTEVYIGQQDNELSACQWLEIARKNIPNARICIMVCKEVDTGYEKYIVETKRNKSHFGENNEYVLVIR